MKKRFTKKELERAAKILGITPLVLKNRLVSGPPKRLGEVLRVGQVASMLGCSPTSVLRWTDEGRIHCLFRHKGKSRRYLRTSIENYIATLKG